MVQARRRFGTRGRATLVRLDLGRIHWGAYPYKRPAMWLRVRKPGALPGSLALAQARAVGAFTSAHEQFWKRARRRDGDAAGTRALIEVLLLHRALPTAAVLA